LSSGLLIVIDNGVITVVFEPATALLLETVNDVFALIFYSKK
jgi:hypothetical protein